MHIALPLCFANCAVNCSLPLLKARALEPDAVLVVALVAVAVAAD